MSWDCQVLWKKRACALCIAKLAGTRNISVEQRAGYSKTSTIPLGRSGKLHEVADLVCYYLSDRSSYITGITTNVAGGKTRG